MKAMRMKQNGVTLIELLVVVAILGILASIAVPSYLDYVSRGNRADAKAVLMENMQFLERNFTVANAYNVDSAGTAITLPFGVSPKTGGTKYNIGFQSGTLSASAYTLEAVPTGSMADDACGTLRISSTGARTATGSLGDDACWNK